MCGDYYVTHGLKIPRIAVEGLVGVLCISADVDVVRMGLRCKVCLCIDAGIGAVYN